MPVTHRARSALVVVHDRRGVARYAYAGEDLTGDFDPDRLAGLVEEGHLEVLHGDDPAVTAGFAEETPAFTGPPAKGAKKSVWEAYARRVGVPEDDIATYDKPGLIDAALAAAENGVVLTADSDVDGDTGVDVDPLD